MRAYIDKKSGLVRYQLYATVTYFGDWRFYDRINYRDENDAVQEGQLTRIGNDANCSALAYSNRCELTEDVGFDLSSIIVERLASVYRPGGTPVSWQFKLKSHYQDTDIVNGIVPAEAAALVSAVSAYKAKLAER